MIAAFAHFPFAVFAFFGMAGILTGFLAVIAVGGDGVFDAVIGFTAVAVGASRRLAPFAVFTCLFVAIIGTFLRAISTLASRFVNTGVGGSVTDLVGTADLVAALFSGLGNAIASLGIAYLTFAAGHGRAIY